MKNNKFIVHIIGPACSGKSSLAKALGDIFPGSYYISYDKLKWQLFGYDRDKHRGIIHALQKGLFEVACKLSVPIILDMFFHSEEEYASFEKIAAQYDYKTTHVQLDAPRDVLLERFRARIQRAKEKGVTLPYADESIFLENLAYRSFVPAIAKAYDTSKTNVKEVAAELAQKLKI